MKLNSGVVEVWNQIFRFTGIFQNVLSYESLFEDSCFDFFISWIDEKVVCLNLEKQFRNQMRNCHIIAALFFLVSCTQGEKKNDVEIAILKQTNRELGYRIEFQVNEIQREMDRNTRNESLLLAANSWKEKSFSTIDKMLKWKLGSGRFEEDLKGLLKMFYDKEFERFAADDKEGFIRRRPINQWNTIEDVDLLKELVRAEILQNTIHILKKISMGVNSPCSANFAKMYFDTTRKSLNEYDLYYFGKNKITENLKIDSITYHGRKIDLRPVIALKPVFASMDFSKFPKGEYWVHGSYSQPEFRPYYEFSLNCHVLVQ